MVYQDNLYNLKCIIVRLCVDHKVYHPYFVEDILGVKKKIRNNGL